MKLPRIGVCSDSVRVSTGPRCVRLAFVSESADGCTTWATADMSVEEAEAHVVEVCEAIERARS